MLNNEAYFKIQACTLVFCRRKWQPTPVFLPGDSQGWGSLVGCRLRGRTGSDTPEATQQRQQQLVFRASLEAVEVKNPPANARDVRLRFEPWVGKIPWRRASQPTPVSPGECHGQRRLAGYSPRGRTESDTPEASEHTQTHTVNTDLFTPLRNS